MKTLLAVLTTVGLSVSAVATAQSLAEIARKERERRKNLAQHDTRSFDDTDLRPSGRVPLPAAEPTPTEESPDVAAAAPEDSPPEQQEEDPRGTESYWRGRIQQVDERISRIEAQLNAPGFAADPANFSRRSRLERELQQARDERAAIAQEARRAGVPPGWLR